MGGYGSGGHNKRRKTVEDYSRIDSFSLYHVIQGDKYLDCKTMVQYHDIIYYVRDKTAEIRCYDDYAENHYYLDLPLSFVPGINGKSERMYFHCPYCGKRVRYLYNARKRYMCRHCLGANYRIQQAGGMDKMIEQMRDIVENKLEYTYWKHEYPDLRIFELYRLPKPPYMRSDKYDRYVQEYRRLQGEYMEKIVDVIAGMKNKLFRRCIR